MSDSVSSEKVKKSFQGDIRLELIFAGLINSTRKRNDLVFYPVGSFKRQFRSDFKELVPADDYKYGLKKPVIEAHRDGLYDLFPEFLFHKNKKRKHFKTVDDLKEESEFNRKIEAASRRMFWPLDHNLFKAKVKIALAEHVNLVPSKSNNQNEILNRFWRIPEFFSKDQRKLLPSVLTLAKSIAASQNWIMQSFSLILNEPVNLEEKWIKSENSFLYQEPLGESELGVSSYCGSRSVNISKVMTLKIGPIENSPLITYIEGGVNYKRVQYLSNYLFPADAEIAVTYIPPSKKSFILSDKQPDLNILGVSTRLNAPE